MIRKCESKKTLFIILALFLLTLLIRNETIKFKKLPQKFVILSTTVRPRYRFLLPVTVKFWNKLGVQSIVVLVKDKNDNNLEIENTLDFLKELSVITKIVYSKKLSSTSLSQMIRLFGAVLPSLNEIMSDDSILMTSDADLVVFNLSNHIPDIKNGKNLRIHNIACCDPINVPPLRGTHKIKMYSMSTTGATVKIWKEIMGINKNIMTIEEIEDYVINEFGIDFFHSNDEYTKIHATFVWFADQSMFGYKVAEWLKTNGNETFSYELLPFKYRIDRSNWPTPEEFTKMNITDYEDCHQPTAPYATGEWEKYKPFLDFALKDDKKFIERFEAYRKEFLKFK